MNSIRQAFRICILNFRKLLHDTRLPLCILTLSALIIGKRTPELRSFCAALGVNASPISLFVVLVESTYNIKLILYLFLMLVCNAPFIDESMPNCIQRTGRRNWFWGTLAYILFVTVGYWLLVFGVCVLSVAGCCEWTLEWGRVFKSLMKTGEIPALAGDTRFLELGTAWDAFVISLTLKSLASMFLALLTWLVNANARKNYGVVLAVIVILLHGHIVGWFVNTKWVYVSPVSLSLLGMLNIDGQIHYVPSVGYAYGFLIIANSVLILMLRLTTARFAIETSAPLK